MAWSGVLWPTVALLPQLAVGGDPRDRLHRWSRHLLPALGVDLGIRGQLRLDVPLWVSNHLSWVDPLVLMSLRPMGTIAKGEVTRYPILGPWARKAGLHFVDRGNPTSRAAALASFAGDLRKGRKMLLFPEGTTTIGDSLAPLQEGGLKAAFALGVPVQPIRLASPAVHYPWTGDDTLLPHLRTLLGTRTPVRLQAEPPLHPSDHAGFPEWLAALRTALHPRSQDVL